MANEKMSALARNIMKITTTPALIDMRRRATEEVKKSPVFKTKAGKALYEKILALPLDPGTIFGAEQK